jgi:hypothetical protein
MLVQEEGAMQNRILKNAMIALLILLSAGLGCTAQTAYDSLRFNQELNCSKMQGPERDDCLKRSDMSYDEYQRQLKAKQPNEGQGSK